MSSFPHFHTPTLRLTFAASHTLPLTLLSAVHVSLPPQTVTWMLHQEKRRLGITEDLWLEIPATDGGETMYLSVFGESAEPR